MRFSWRFQGKSKFLFQTDQTPEKVENPGESTIIVIAQLKGVPFISL